MIQLSPAETERFEERAAIIEFEGKLTREQAERLAYKAITDSRSNQMESK
jgi:hypothetical protein